MPRLHLMTWEPGPRRWRKVYRGKAYTVSCTQLRVRDTKEASYQAANDWWTARRAEIDGQPRPHSEPELLDELTRRRDWARANDHKELADEYDRRIAISDRTDSPSLLLLPPNVEGRLAGLKAMGVKLPERADPHTVNAILGEGRIWDERLRKSLPEVPEDRTVGVQIDKYLAFQLARYKAGQISVSDCDQTRQYLTAFRDWLGAGTQIDKIGVERWQGWYENLLGCGRSLDTRKKRFRRARDFVAWLGERGLLQIPPNLHSRRFRFKSEPKLIRTMTTDEVGRIVAAAPGQLKLHLLLMLNCGFTQQDVSDLTRAEVDWVGGKILRKRSKTGDQDKVPTVEYPLWGETIALLKQFRAASGDRVLTTQSGLPWVRDSIDDAGTRHRVDAIKSNYAHLAKRLKFDKPMSLLRKTGASKLEEHPDHGRYAQYFLGHAPTSVAARHYVVPSREQFSAAVKWLGSQFGL